MPAAGPLAQVNDAAAVAAKREVRAGAIHRFLADGAAELESALARHTEFLF